MFYANQRKQVLSRGIFALWYNWVIGIGCILLLIISAPLLTPKFVPVLAVLLEFLLLYLERVNRRSATPTCFRIPYIAQTVLFWSALALIATVIYTSTNEVYEFNGQPFNIDNPLIPIFVTAPITVMACLYYMMRKRNSSLCNECSRRNGEAAQRSILSVLYNRETMFQIRFLFVASLLATIIVWGYYFTRFNNVSINRADTFIFIGVPCILYILSLIYLGVRCYSIHMYYCRNEGMERFISRSGTTVRYIVISGDNMLANVPEPTPGMADDIDVLKIDVPLKYVMSFRENVSLHEGISMFVEATGLRDADIREIYHSHDYGMYNNIFHFVVYLKPEEMETAATELKSQWFPLHQIRDMLYAGLLNPDLVAELRRIHTIAMTWKTYDRRGFRLYPIKHYKPSFTLRDMHTWDVDFNDTTWLRVAELNQDKPFFHLRRLWTKVVKGISE